MPKEAKKPSTRCVWCGEPLYFFRHTNVFLDRSFDKFRKHPCTAPEEKYSPYNADGKPTLKALKTWFEKDGWIPFHIKLIEHADDAVIVTGTLADTPSIICFWARSFPHRIKGLPTYVKRSDRNPGEIILDFIDDDSCQTTRHTFTEGNMTLLELAAVG